MTLFAPDPYLAPISGDPTPAFPQMSEPLVPGSLEREIRDLRAVLFSDRDPDGRGFAPLADALRRAGDLGQAVEVVEAGVRRLPDFASGHVVAGWVYRARADEEESERSFRKVLELDDENVSALKGLGFLLAERGQSAEALGLFQRLEDLDPGDPEVRARLVELGDSDRTGPPSGLSLGPVEIGDLAPGSEKAGVVVDIDALGPGGTEISSRTTNGATFDEGVVEIAALAPDESTVVDIGDLAPDLEAAAVSGSEEPVAPVDESVPTRTGPEDRPDPREEDSDDGPATRTMAEVFVRQGHVDRAVRIYRRLAEERPDDASILARLAEIDGSADTASEGVEGEDASLPVTDYLEALLAWRPASGSEETEEDEKP